MSTYSPNLRLELITTGTQAGTWGNTTNSNYQYIFEQAIAGAISVTTSAASQALTYVNGPTSTAAANQSVFAILTLSTSTGANFAVYAPPVSKLYVIYNASSYTATIYNSTVIGNTTAAGSGIAIPAGEVMTVWSNGTNFYQQNTALISPHFSGVPTAPTASAGTNTTQLATTAFVGTAVLNATGALGTMSTQNANNVNITGGSITGITDLAVADGGTGASNAANARTNLGLVIGTNIPSPTGTGASGTWAIDVTGNAATATASTTQTNGDNSTKIATTAYVQNMGLGWGQTWQSVTRSNGTTYYNTTGRPIFGVAGFNSLTNNMAVSISINGSAALTIASSFSGGVNYSGAAGSYIIPPGASYVLYYNNVNGYSVYNQELR